MKSLIFSCVALLGLTSFAVADGGGPTFAPSFRSRTVIRQRAPLFQRNVYLQRNVYAQPQAAFIPVPVPQYVPVPVAVPQYVPVPVAVPSPTYAPPPRQRAPYCP